MMSLRTTSGHPERTSHFVTCHSETTLQNEYGRVMRGFWNCWRLGSLGRLLVMPAIYTKCSFYFNCYFSTRFEQSGTSDRKLYISPSGAGGQLTVNPQIHLEHQNCSWVNVFTCKNVVCTCSYVLYSHGCNKFLHAKMFFTLTDTTSILMFAMYLHARMFCTLAPYVFYSHGCNVRA